MSSLTKKYVMALTGVGLFVFVLGHLMGNLQIFLGPEWLNSYAKHLMEWPLVLWPMRVILLALLIVHMTLAIRLSIENKKARPVGYTRSATVQASFASRTMLLSGFAIFFFILFHLMHLTFGRVYPEFFHLVDSKGRHDVYSMVILGFRDKWITLTYLVAVGFLSLHLSHGLSSFLQSLGLLREDNLGCARKFARLTALFVFLGYSSIAVCSWAGVLKPTQGL